MTQNSINYFELILFLLLLPATIYYLSSLIMMFLKFQYYIFYYPIKWVCGWLVLFWISKSEAENYDSTSTNPIPMFKQWDPVFTNYTYEGIEEILSVFKIKIPTSKHGK